MPRASARWVARWRIRAQPIRARRASCVADAGASPRLPPPWRSAPDQQATLQLLLERGTELRRSRPAARPGRGPRSAPALAAALTELGGADPDRNVGLTDYLLGQADPIGRADASRHLREDPADHELADELCESLREMFPAAPAAAASRASRRPVGARPAAPVARPPGGRREPTAPRLGALARADAADRDRRQRRRDRDRRRARDRRCVRRRLGRRGDRRRDLDRRAPPQAPTSRSRRWP